MTVYELEVPLVLPRFGALPAPPLSANQRLHWRTQATLVRIVRTGVKVAAMEAKIPPAEQLTVQLHYRPGDNRRRDADNLFPTFKAACDALARGRKDWVGLELVKDDTPEYMTKLGPVIHPGPGTRRLWLTVEAR